MSAPMTIYDFIDRNNRNTLLLVLLFPITLCLLVFVLTFIALLLFDIDGALTFGGAGIAAALSPEFLQKFFNITENTTYMQAILIASLGLTALGTIPIFIVSGVWMLVAYFHGSDMILSASMANPVKRTDSPEIYALVENVAIAAGLPTPKLYIIQDESLNAFATGRDIYHASITLTTGLIKTLDRQELKAVIGHEMAHIGNRDIRLMLMIIIGIGISVFLSDLLFKVITSSRPRSSSNNNNGGAGALYLIIIVMALSLALFSFLIAPLLRFAISRSQEYQADATSAIITRNPGALARALEKISVDSRVEALDNMPSVGALCIANPLSDGKKRLFDSLSGLYATHPPIKKRIQALRTMDSM